MLHIRNYFRFYVESSLLTWYQATYRHVKILGIIREALVLLLQQKRSRTLTGHFQRTVMLSNKNKKEKISTKHDSTSGLRSADDWQIKDQGYRLGFEDVHCTF